VVAVGIIDIILGWDESKPTLPTLPWENFKRTDQPAEQSQSDKNSEIIANAYSQSKMENVMYGNAPTDTIAADAASPVKAAMRDSNPAGGELQEVQLPHEDPIRPQPEQQEEPAPGHLDVESIELDDPYKVTEPK